MRDAVWLRRNISTHSKDAIGHAAGLIPDGCSLFINVGTTTEAVVRHLTDYNDLLVATNNINVVNTLIGCEKIKILVAAGTVHDDGAITGETAVQFQRRAPIRIVTIDDIDCFVTDINPPATFIKRCNEAEVEVIVTDHKKQGFTKNKK